MSKSLPRLSVILPTYNESDNIPILIGKLEKVLAELPHEIIVVDDNSPDGTWEVAQAISLKNPNVRVLRRFNESGLSSAVMSGMSMAQGEVFAVMDSDLQHDEEILPELFRVITEDGFDVAIGSRGAEGGSYGDWSKRRRFMSAVAAGMARVLLPVQVSDPMSGFFAVSRDCFNRTAESINPRGFKILLEFIGRTRGLKIKEVGYTFRNRIHGETKLSASVIRNYLIALYDIRFGKLVSPTFMLYAFVGTTGVVVNLLGFVIGEALSFPHVNTGLSKYLDPVYLAAPFGYQLAILSNYILNNYITFFEKRHRGLSNVWWFLVFEVISIFGLLVFVGTFQLLQINGFLKGAVEAGVLGESLRTYINNGLGMIVALVSNYYLNTNWTWARRPR